MKSFHLKKTLKGTLRLALSALLGAALFLSGCSSQTENKTRTPDAEENQLPAGNDGRSLDTSVHFIDVGQGLSILIQSDGHFMLYDGGDRKASSLVVAYLKEQGVKTLDYVIASHYDADHLNGVVGALHAYDVKEVLAPDYETDTKVFQSFQSVIEEKQIPLTHPKPGDSFTFGNVSFTVLAPQDKTYKKPNDYSIVIRLTAGDVSFLITGDAESTSEEEMVLSGLPLESTVYVAGHHGSASSGSWDFLQKAVPEYTVISCGSGNSYGHPHAETMEKLEAMEIPVYRTDKQGTIIASTDGTTLSWSVEPCNDYTPGDPNDKPAKPAETKANKDTEKQTSDKTELTEYTEEPYTESADRSGSYTYILNTSSQLIHRPECSSTKEIAENNKEVWTGSSLEQCLEAHPGYRGCKRCNPE